MFLITIFMTLGNFSIAYATYLITHKFDLTIKQTQRQLEIPIHFCIKVQTEVKSGQKRLMCVESQV